MDPVTVHDLNAADAVSKIESNLAKREASRKKRAGDRTAKNAKRAKQHKEFVQQVYTLAK